MTATATKEISKELQAETPALVQHGFAMVNFVRAVLERDKKDNGFVLYELSLALAEEHEKYVPRKVRKAWVALLENDMKQCMVKDIPPQKVELAIAPDGDDKSLQMDACHIEKMKLTLVKEKGTGKIREYVRMSCSVRISVSDTSLRFARMHFSHNVWLKWNQAQGEIFN